MARVSSIESLNGSPTNLIIPAKIPDQDQVHGARNINNDSFNKTLKYYKDVKNDNICANLFPEDKAQEILSLNEGKNGESYMVSGGDSNSSPAAQAHNASEVDTELLQLVNEDEIVSSSKDSAGNFKTITNIVHTPEEVDSTQKIIKDKASISEDDYSEAGNPQVGNSISTMVTSSLPPCDARTVRINSRKEGATCQSCFDQRAREEISKAAYHVVNSNNKAGNLLVEDEIYILEAAINVDSISTFQQNLSSH